jgi:hypothetical protein
MVLGQVLARLSDEAFATETLIGLRDLALMALVGQAGRAVGESFGEYAVGATRRFSANAGEEDWLAMMTAIERASDPGAACLRHMLEWSLRHEEGCRGGCA